MGTRREREVGIPGTGETNGNGTRATQRAVRLALKRVDPAVSGLLGVRTAAELGVGVNTVVNVTAAQTPLPDTNTVVENTTLLRTPDSLGDVKLRMFDPFNNAEISALVRHYAGEKSLGSFARMLDPVVHAQDEATRKRKIISADSSRARRYDKARVEYLSTFKNRLKRRINRHVYDLIKKEFNLASNEDAAKKFEQARQYANQAVSNHLQLTHPEMESDITRDWVKLPHRPADLLEMALTTQDAVLRYELQRQFANTVIALQQERGRSVVADFKLTQIQELLEAQLYTPSEDEYTSTLYGEFKQGTNELIRLYHGSPTRTKSRVGHFKLLPVQVRPLKNGMHMMTEIDRKDPGAGIRKAIRKTIEDVNEQKAMIGDTVMTRAHSETSTEGPNTTVYFDDTIRTNEKVRDTHRMTLVVLGDEKARNELAYQLFGMIVDPKNAEFFQDKDIYGDVIKIDGKSTGGPTGDGEIKTENRGGTGQKIVNYIKLRVEFDNGADKPINVEILIQDAESYFREKYEVGRYDPGLDDITGPAHGPYGIAREEVIKGVYVPREIYPGLYDQHQHQPTPVQEEAARLRRRNRI